MPEKSLFTIDIPQNDLLTWLFPPGVEPSNKPIWIDAERPQQRSLSPRQMLQWVKRLGMGLHNLGLKEDDVVLTLTTNHIFVPVVYLAAAGHGYIFSGCNPAYTVSEVKYQIENTTAKVIFLDPTLLDVGLKAAEAAHFPTSRIFLFSDEECEPVHALKDWRSILGSEDASKHWQWNRIRGETFRTKIAVLNYSSGTTGLPKVLPTMNDFVRMIITKCCQGVEITHENIIANVEQSLFMRRLSSTDQSTIIPESSLPPERWLGFLPLYHAYGQLWSIAAAARSLTPVYFMRSFDYKTLLSHIETYKITHIQTAPPLLVMLAKRLETRDYDLSSLRNILCGAAPLSKELQNDVMTHVGKDLKVVQTWGMTEVTCSLLHVPGQMADVSGAVGLIDPNCEMKLLSDDGKEVGDGERGEIHVRGPNVCRGYWRNEEATRNTFGNDGFMSTGDVAIKEKGWYWIVDRKKELIKVKGFQVAPAELEAVLLENDNVADAAVVALHVEDQEKPRAYIVLKEHAQGKVNSEDIVKWIAKLVSSHKHLTGGVQIIDGDIPKSPSGKIQRVVLKEWAKRDAAAWTSSKAKL